MSWPTPGAAALLDAMQIVEGGPEGLIRAVRWVRPETEHLTEARRVALDTVSQALWDYVIGEHPGEVKNFVYFLRKHWPDTGHRDWPGNVLAVLDKPAEV